MRSLPESYYRQPARVALMYRGSLRRAHNYARKTQRNIERRAIAGQEGTQNMSTRSHWTVAPQLALSVFTPASTNIPDEYDDGDMVGGARLVIEDGGNCEAVIIDGTPDQLAQFARDILTKLEDAVPTTPRQCPFHTPPHVAGDWAIVDGEGVADRFTTKAEAEAELSAYGEGCIVSHVLDPNPCGDEALDKP